MDKRFNIEVIYKGKAEIGHVMALFLMMQFLNSIISVDLSAKTFCGVKKLQKNQQRRKVIYEFSKSN